MNTNKTIHEAMGLCWHDYKLMEPDNPYNYAKRCHCGLRFTPATYTENPDYTAPVHYCALMDWMREDDRATLFSIWLQSKSDRLQVYCFVSHWIEDKPKKQITLIAEAIEAGVLK